MRLAALYRYPVKGLSPEALPSTRVEVGGSLPGDRLYAVENGPSGFDPAAPAHQPKIKYLMLMRNGALARLVTRYDDATTELVITEGGVEQARGQLATAEGRAVIESFLAGFMAAELRGPPRVLTAPDGYRFMDSMKGFVSLISLSTVGAIEAAAGAPVDPLRFRGNLYVEGLEPFAEFDLVGKVLAIGPSVRLEVLARTDRCAATNVDPLTGLRDLAIPALLERRFGHMDCGVYARVVAGGAFGLGDRLSVVEPAARDAAGLPF